MLFLTSKWHIANLCSLWLKRRETERKRERGREGEREREREVNYLYAWDLWMSWDTGLSVLQASHVLGDLGWTGYPKVKVHRHIDFQCGKIVGQIGWLVVSTLHLCHVQEQQNDIPQLLATIKKIIYKLMRDFS